MALRILAGIVGGLLALVALAVNVSFYMTYGQTGVETAIFIALAVLSMAIKFIAPASAARMRGFIIVQAALWVGFMAAVCFDSFGVAGFMEMTYGSKSGESAQEVKDYAAAKLGLGKLQGRLDEYAGTRSTREVDTDLRNARAVAGTCSAKRADTDTCKGVAKLEAEAARAAERDTRTQALAEAQSKFDTLKKPAAVTDPQAVVVKRIAERIGLNGAENFVSPIISILIFVFFEIFLPALAFFALHGARVREPARKLAAVVPLRPPRRKNGRTASSPDGVLDLLRDLVTGARQAPGVVVTGRKVYGPQRALGAACDMSGPAMNRHLKALAASSTIALIAGSGGTEIEVLGDL